MKLETNLETLQVDYFKERLKKMPQNLRWFYLILIDGKKSLIINNRFRILSYPPRVTFYLARKNVWCMIFGCDFIADS